MTSKERGPDVGAGWIDETHEWDPAETRPIPKTVTMEFSITPNPDMLKLFFGDPTPERPVPGVDYRWSWGPGWKTVMVPKPPTPHPIDLEQVKWTATPDNPKPDPNILDIPLQPWQHDRLQLWTKEFAEYKVIVNEIRILAPPADFEAALDEVRRLHHETPLSRTDAAQLVRERLAVTGKYTIADLGRDPWKT